MNKETRIHLPTNLKGTIVQSPLGDRYYERSTYKYGRSKIKT